MAKSKRGLADMLEQNKASLPVMLSAAELVEMGIFPSKSALFILRKKNKGPPCLRLGGQFSYNVDDLIEWINKKYVEAGL